MTREKIKETIVEILDIQLGAEPDKITDETTFVSLGADSLDTVEIVMAVEEAFSVEITDEEAESCTTVGAAIDHVHGLLNHQ